jgi:hypothetical protein
LARLINLYRGKQYRGIATYDRLLVNICFQLSILWHQLFQLVAQRLMLTHAEPEDGDKAILTEAIINYWWQHYQCQEEFQRAVKDYLIIGHGWVKTGYRFVEEEKVDDIENTADELAAPPTG